MPEDATDEQDWHQCHFCGDYVNQRGYGTTGKRHFLSDCRPDLVEHEPGPTCTWSYDKDREPSKNCYAYRDDRTNQWTDDHVHFYPDGPM